MLLALTVSAQWFEAVMMLCFGASWPAAIYKTLRTRRTEGKSLLFLTLVLIGYLAGILAKFVTAIEQWTWPNWVTILYAINAGMVAFDMYLYHRFRPRQKPDLGEPTLP